MKELASEQAVVQQLGDTAGPDSRVSSLPPPPEAPAAATPTGELTIQPDSVVQVGVKEDPGLDGSYRINEIYAIEQLGYVGPVFLRNMTEKQAAGKIKEVLEKRFFNKATVSVRILRASYDKVAVYGTVGSPGVVQIGSGDSITLNEALLRTGRLTTAIKGAKVRIVRGGMLSAVAPSQSGEVYSLTQDDGAPDVPDVSLWNTDVAYVFSAAAQPTLDRGTPVDDAPKQVLVLGEVKRQGMYRFEPASPCTLMHLIFKMGGFEDYADAKSIVIIRRDKSGEEEEITVDATRVLKTGDPDEDIALENGDRVIVPARRLGIF